MIATSTDSLKRAKLLKLAATYRDKGYKVEFQQEPEDVPNFLRNYQPDIIARNENEAVVVEVTSRASLDTSSAQYLQDLAQAVEKHPGWRFELVMINPEPDNALDVAASEGSLRDTEIQSRLQLAKQLVEQDLESGLLYTWSLVEASLRLATEKEGLRMQSISPKHLIKRLTVEGVISRSDYQELMDALSLRNTVAHGFKTTQLKKQAILQLIRITETLLKSIHFEEALA